MAGIDILEAITIIGMVSTAVAASAIVATKRLCEG